MGKKLEGRIRRSDQRGRSSERQRNSSDRLRSVSPVKPIHAGTYSFESASVDDKLIGNEIDCTDAYFDNITAASANIAATTIDVLNVSELQTTAVNCQYCNLGDATADSLVSPTATIDEIDSNHLNVNTIVASNYVGLPAIASSGPDPQDAHFVISADAIQSFWGISKSWFSSIEYSAAPLNITPQYYVNLFSLSFNNGPRIAKIYSGWHHFGLPNSLKTDLIPLQLEVMYNNTTIETLTRGGDSAGAGFIDGFASFYVSSASPMAWDVTFRFFNPSTTATYNPTYLGFEPGDETDGTPKTTNGTVPISVCPSMRQDSLVLNPTV
jgi:hypothetical protein